MKQLDLVELVLTDQPTHIPTVRPRLGSKTGRVGHISQRELRLIESLLAMQIRQRYLGSRGKIVVVVLELEEVLGKLG